MATKPKRTVFNAIENSYILTNGEKYGPITVIFTEKEAHAYFKALVDYYMWRWNETDRAKAEQIELKNIVYYAGYFSNKTANRVWRMFRAYHDILG